MKANIRHVHSSSRFDRAPVSLFKAFKRYAKRSDLITWTEIEAETRERVLRTLKGWNLISGDKSYANDCGISYRATRLRLVESGNESTGAERYSNVKGLLRDPAFVTWGVFEDLITGDTLVVVVVHLASSIEGDLARKRNTRRTASFLTGFAGTMKIARRLRKEYKADGAMVVADFNLNFKLAWVRALVKSLAPRWQHTWKRLPKGGTHGSRVIDATLLWGRLRVHGSAGLMRDDQSSDHRPYKEWLRWVPRRRRA